MQTLIISRKAPNGIGGLSTFAKELSINIKGSILLSPSSFKSVFKKDTYNINVIHLCDATLLPLGVFLKVILDRPLTVTAHGLDLTYNNKLYQLILSLLLPLADAVVLDCQPAKSL